MVTLADAPVSNVYVTSVAPVTKFVMLWLPSGLKHVFVCGGAVGISTVTSPVHRVVILSAPAGNKYMPLIVIVSVHPVV